MKLRQLIENKQKLSSTLLNWLPILHASLGDLQESIAPMLDGNMVAEIECGFEKNSNDHNVKKIFNNNINNRKTSQHGYNESIIIKQDSLYDVLHNQITTVLFPTPNSQSAAFKIIENLNSDGYYEGDSIEDAKSLNMSEDFFELVRQRFAYLNPVGIGSKDYKESFHFQLLQVDVDCDIFNLATKMINNLDQLIKFSKMKKYKEALKIIQSFVNPPALEYIQKDLEIIPDLYILSDDSGKIEVTLNNQFYPKITINNSYKVKHALITEKIKEAKSLVDALEMRKATLYKVGLMIVEYQYDFFKGGDMIPMTLKTLADEFGHNPSTISRAIANKYIMCDRGVIAMKKFFTAALDDISNDVIKKYVSSKIKEENHKKPFSDMKLLAYIQEKFNIKIQRRTIAKYRKQLCIGGSSERKKLYLLRDEN